MPGHSTKIPTEWDFIGKHKGMFYTQNTILDWGCIQCHMYHALKAVSQNRRIFYCFSCGLPKKYLSYWNWHMLTPNVVESESSYNRSPMMFWLSPFCAKHLIIDRHSSSLSCRSIGYIGVSVCRQWSGGPKKNHAKCLFHHNISTWNFPLKQHGRMIVLLCVFPFCSSVLYFMSPLVKAIKLIPIWTPD